MGEQREYRETPNAYEQNVPKQSMVQKNKQKTYQMETHFM